MQEEFAWLDMGSEIELRAFMRDERVRATMRTPTYLTPDQVAALLLHTSVQHAQRRALGESRRTANQLPDDVVAELFARVYPNSPDETTLYTGLMHDEDEEANALEPALIAGAVYDDDDLCIIPEPAELVPPAVDPVSAEPPTEEPPSAANAADVAAGPVRPPAEPPPHRVQTFFTPLEDEESPCTTVTYSTGYNDLHHYYDQEYDSDHYSHYTLESYYDNNLSMIRELPSFDSFPASSLALPFLSSTGTAPEDAEIPHPSIASHALHFMEMTPEEADAEYEQQLPDRINPDFIKACPALMPLMLKLGRFVFVPQNWEGARIPALKLRFAPDFPATLHARLIPVNPRLYVDAKLEFDRLRKYHFVPSTSSRSSNLVVAPKETKPFVRLCGNYIPINKYILSSQHPIPDVKHAIERIQQYTYFADVDMVNSFHQLPLSLETSEALSIITPWGLFRPKFLPEGVAPASFQLQALIDELFSGFDYVIAIFDNILILAHTFDELYVRLEAVLLRCKEYNIFLKFSKSFIGYSSAKFFGYEVSRGQYKLTNERLAEIDKIPFPTTIKSMQSFLGVTVFCQSFVPNYGQHAAHLHDMTKKDFSFTDKTTWTKDYLTCFTDFKKALAAALVIHFPDYDNDFVLRTDASLIGCGGVLFMRKRLLDSTFQDIVIAIVSHKFTEQASRWATYEQEAYAIFYCIKKLSYYLYCKPFVVETDHNNLRWMDTTLVPKVMRWRAYLSSFVFFIHHIPGTQNGFADWLSRMHAPALPALETLSAIAVASADPYDMCRQAHDGRMGHPGIRRTWANLLRLFPGHRISAKLVQDYVSACPLCQKTRLGMTNNYQSLVLNNKVQYQRSTIGIDTLTISPADRQGNLYLFVIVNFFTNHVYGYASATKDAESMAAALFQYICTFGLCDYVRTDPGSEFTNDMMKNLNEYIGLNHQLTLVDRPEANGVERSNAEVLGFITRVCSDQRLIHKWSAPDVLPIVWLLINNHISSETGQSPNDMTFGTLSHKYFDFPPEINNMDKCSAYVVELDKNLRYITQVSNQYQQELVSKRNGKVTEANQDLYQPGDYILLRLDPAKHKPNKLYPKFEGPYEVIAHKRNNITCRHVTKREVFDFHNDDVKLFIGDKDAAVRLAQLDGNHYIITSINKHRGDPEVRQTMEFQTTFADGETIWKPWSTELFDTQQYEAYIRQHRDLYPLLFKLADFAKIKKQMNGTAITGANPGDHFYLDLRAYGYPWYKSLALPDDDDLTYVFDCVYTRFPGKRLPHKLVEYKNIILDELYDATPLTVYMHCHTTALSAKHILITAPFLVANPDIIPDTKRVKLLRKLQNAIYNNT
jgi:hypothetical protein